jgi:hypothetical protein
MHCDSFRFDLCFCSIAEVLRCSIALLRSRSVYSLHELSWELARIPHAEDVQV